MAWTYGAGTGDDTVFDAVSSITSGMIAFTACWVYPTTLTATRTIFSFGANWRIRIDTTTSELRLVSDNTTDGEWTTTGVNLATNSWTFLAVIANPSNTGPVCDWRVWAGTLETPPAEVTVTNAVAPVGNFGGSTAVCIGNADMGGTVAFQGSIESFVFGNFSGFLNATTGAFPIAASGTITQAEADLIRDQYVTPIWRGNLFPYPKAFGGPPAGTSGLNWCVIRTDYMVQLTGQRAPRDSRTSPPFELLSNNGVTAGPVRGPVPPMPGQHVTVKPLARLR